MFCGKRGDYSSPLLSTAGLLVCAAAGWRCGIIRTSTERAQTALGVRNAEHSERSRLMLAVEWRRLGRVEVAGGQSRRVLWIVEPEAQVKCVRRSQAHVGVKTEDIVQKNRLDLDVAFIRALANLNIGLIPGQTEAPCEIGVFSAIGLEEAVLYGEQVKSEARLDPIQIQNERVINFAADDGGVSLRFFKRIGTQAVNHRWVRQQVEPDLVLVVLGGGDARDDQKCARRQQAATNSLSGSAAPELLAAIVIHFFLLVGLLDLSSIAAELLIEAILSGQREMPRSQFGCRVSFCGELTVPSCKSQEQESPAAPN